MITPRPSPDDSTPKPGFPMRPFFGIDPVLVDDKVSHVYGMCNIDEGLVEGGVVEYSSGW